MKGFNEDMACFFERPSREGLRDLLQRNNGEQNNLDFKSDWCSFPKLAKHILAFANSGGGCIVFGVTQLKDGTLDATGLDNVIDKANINNSVTMFIPSGVQYEVLDFKYTDSEYEKIKGKKFQVLFIEDDPKHIPFISKAESEGINKDIIYIRKGTSSKQASYEELQAILNRRLETDYSSTSELELEEHIAQLKVLYNNIDKYHYEGGIFRFFGKALTEGIKGERVANPVYPTEDFEDFIARVIEAKKKRIEKVLDIV